LGELSPDTLFRFGYADNVMNAPTKKEGEMATKGFEKLRADKDKHQTNDSDTYFCVQCWAE